MLLATGGANEGRILLVPWGSRTGMSPAASPYARPERGGMLKVVRIQELTQPWHGSDAAASEKRLWAHKLTGGGSATSSVTATLRRKRAQEFPRSSCSPHPGAGWHLPAAAVSNEGRSSPQKERRDSHSQEFELPAGRDE